MKQGYIFIFVVLIAMTSYDAGAQTAPPSRLADPFVRGLNKLDTRLRLEREEVKRLKTLRSERQDDTPPEPDFAQSFSANHYRPKGILVSAQPSEPVIHIHRSLPRAGIYYWSGSERQWVYLRKEGETLADMATKFTMQVDDILALNNALREAQLATPMRLYISPRDNAPLIHIVRRGETLHGLARIYRTEIAHLRARNELGADDKLRIGQRLRIRERALTRAMIAKAAPMPSVRIDDAARLAHQAYVRLARFDNLAMARRGAHELWQQYGHFIDSDLILRVESKDARLFYHLEIGPMHSLRHARGWCALMRDAYQQCEGVMRMRGDERQDSFSSQAVVSLSPHVFYDSEGEELGGTADIERAKHVTYHLFEGQILGKGAEMIAKITPYHIYLANMRGVVRPVPFYYVPEIDPAIVRARQEQERAAALAQAALLAQGDLEGVAEAAVQAGDGATPNIVTNLKEGENVRRLGSTEALNKLLGSDFN